jgi:hypothetical protein
MPFSSRLFYVSAKKGDSGTVEKVGIYPSQARLFCRYAPRNDKKGIFVSLRAQRSNLKSSILGFSTAP